jgi:rhodanese-related sulfurtransferase
MGVRDRLRLLIGRERRAEPVRSGGAPSVRGAEPAQGPGGVAGGGKPPAPEASAWSAPTAWSVEALRSRADAVVIDARASVGWPGAVPLPADLRAFAVDARAGRPVVVICEDGVRSSGIAERLGALGVRAGWLEGGAA